MKPSLAAACLCLLPLQACAHGTAEWIERGGYVGNDGRGCCGPRDCRVAEPGEIERRPGGWRHVPTGTAILDDQAGIYQSTDWQMWICVRNGELKCLFWSAGT